MTNKKSTRLISAAKSNRVKNSAAEPLLVDGIMPPAPMKQNCSMSASKQSIPSNRLKPWKYVFGIILVILGFTFTPASSSHSTALNSESVLQVINQDRSFSKVNKLRLNPALSKAAREKAQHMLTHEYFDHISPDGTRPWDFIKNQSLYYQFAGENLAINYDNPLELQKDFMNSTSHRQNLLSPLFTDAGIAVVSGEMNGQQVTLIVEMFAATSPAEITVNNN